jgi:hypothetical protein
VDRPGSLVKRHGSREGAGWLVAALLVLSGVVAHVSAGGDWPSVGSAGLLAGLAMVSVCVSGGFRWTFPRLLVALVVSQFVVHVALSGAHRAGGERMMASHAMPSHEHAVGWSMPVAHATLAVATAVVIRYGCRWLTRMPGLVLAVCCPTPPVRRWTPVSVPVSVVLACDRGVSHVPGVWRSRAPPMSAVV